MEKKENKVVKIILPIIVIVVIGILFVVSIIETKGRYKYYIDNEFYEIVELVEKDELNVVYWASPDCHFCKQFKPTVLEVSSNKKVNFNYLDVSSLNQLEYDRMYEDYFIDFDESYNTFREENGHSLGTPTVIIFKNNKVVDMNIGASSKEELIEFLAKNGVIDSEK